MVSNHFNMHSIRREARREAWYSDSLNPFGKRRITRASTFPQNTQDRDIESGRVREDETPLSPLAAAHSSPTIPQSSGSNGLNNPIRFKAEEYEMSEQSGVEPSANGGPRDPESVEGATVIPERQSTRDDNNEGEVINRHGVKFWKHGEKIPQDGEEEVEKKRPWYKGKILPHKEPFTIRNQLERTIFSSWVNILLLAAPVGIAINYAGINGKIVFVINFIAIVPLAGMLGFATEEIALHVGESLGGLLNATFGNAVEMIVAIIALAKDEITVVQTSLVGSILSNLLLVLGMCFFFGGLRRPEQNFNIAMATTSASLLALSVGALIIPTCFDQFTSTDTTRAPPKTLAALSRGTSVILLVVYGAYLVFQLKTHSGAFNEESQKVPMRPRKHALPKGAISKGLASVGGIGAGPGRAQIENRPPNDELLNQNAHEEEADKETEEPQLHIAVAWATLAGATAIIGLCAEFMVNGISDITTPGSGISVEFVGLILLPIVGNAAEHMTALVCAVRDKMDLAIGVAVGSSMQVSLFLIPLMVIIGWIMGKDDMNLSFDGFQVTVLFVAVLLVNYLTGDGKSNYLEGFLLQSLYLVCAVCAWYYPQKDPTTGLVTSWA